MRKYSEQEVQRAYENWVATREGIDREYELTTDWGTAFKTRCEAWDEYCDRRDQLEPGTSKSKRLRRQANLFAVS